MTRKNVERRRDIVITKEQWTDKIRANAIVEATRNMAHDEYIIGIEDRSGRYVPFGSMDGEEVYYHHKVLVVAKMEPENDEEFEKRVKEEENQKRRAIEKEKTEYLRLKAKYGDLQMVDGNLPEIEEEAYTVTTETVKHYHYNPAYGDDRVCKCGHPYYRHFDTYEDMAAVGCKYCECFHFEEATPEEVANFPEDI